MAKLQVAVNWRKWWRETVGDWIRLARVSRKMTQADVASKLEWARTTVVAIEAGKQAVTLDQLVDLSRLYGCDIHSFLPLDLRTNLTNLDDLDLGSEVRKRVAARRAARR